MASSRPRMPGLVNSHLTSCLLASLAPDPIPCCSSIRRDPLLPTFCCMLMIFFSPLLLLLCSIKSSTIFDSNSPWLTLAPYIIFLVSPSVEIPMACLSPKNNTPLKILQRANMLFCNPCATPIDARTKLPTGIGPSYKIPPSTTTSLVHYNISPSHAQIAPTLFSKCASTCMHHVNLIFSLWKASSAMSRAPLASGYNLLNPQPMIL